MAENLEGKFFVFDFKADYTEGTSAIVVLQVREGVLKEFYHPADSSLTGVLGRRQNQEALNYLVSEGVTEVYTTAFKVEDPKKFLGLTMLHRHELTAPNLIPGQWSWYCYEPINDLSEKKKLLEVAGIELIVIEPYITTDQNIKKNEDS